MVVFRWIPNSFYFSLCQCLLKFETLLMKRMTWILLATSTNVMRVYCALCTSANTRWIVHELASKKLTQTARHTFFFLSYTLSKASWWHIVSLRSFARARGLHCVGIKDPVCKRTILTSFVRSCFARINDRVSVRFEHFSQV